MKRISLSNTLSSPALEWTPGYTTNRQDVVLDIFRHHISYKDGLPPYAQARIIDLIANQLIKARPHPGLGAGKNISSVELSLHQQTGNRDHNQLDVGCH